MANFADLMNGMFQSRGGRAVDDINELKLKQLMDMLNQRQGQEVAAGALMNAQNPDGSPRMFPGINRTEIQRSAPVGSGQGMMQNPGEIIGARQVPMQAPQPMMDERTRQGFERTAMGGPLAQWEAQRASQAAMNAPVKMAPGEVLGNARGDILNSAPFKPDAPNELLNPDVFDAKVRLAKATQAPAATKRGVRPITPEELQSFGLDNTGAYGWDQDENKPVVITQPKQANPTESQQKMAYLSARVADTLSNVKKVLDEDPSAVSNFWLEQGQDSAIPGVDYLTRKNTNPNAQMVRNDMIDAVDAIITMGTGAAYTQEQLEAARNSVMPRAGEPEAVKKRKFDKLMTFYSAGRESARGAGKDLPDPSVFGTIYGGTQARTPAANTPGKRVLIQNGSRFDENGNYLGPAGK